MVLVDTSVWVAHLRLGKTGLELLLNEGLVISHRFVIGELACGNIQNRAEILSLLRALPYAVFADDLEVLRFIDGHSLAGKGLGYIDMHLLASAVLSRASIWTLDRRLAEASSRLGIRH